MHELSVCLSLCAELERIAAAHPGRQVTTVVVGIGPLAGVEPALIRNAWPLAATGTVAAQAELHIVTGDVVVRCTTCGAESTVPANRLLCAACGDFRTRVIAGDEFLLERVELANVACALPA